MPCEKSFARLSPDAVRHVIEDGYPGVADVATSSRPFVRANPDDESDNSGNVNAWIGGKPIPLGYQIPEALRKGMNIKITNLTINDSHVFAVGIGDGRGRYRDLLFRKSDRTWHTFPMAAEVDNVRGFGKYIATMEVTKPKSVDALSAGMERWRPEAGKMGPQLAGRVALSGHFYPGKLFLYDVDTERVFPIVTNDGDSEVLLVENNIVYYRASDRLYSAVIEKDHVGRGQLLVTNDVIRDAHWAFIKH